MAVYLMTTIRRLANEGSMSVSPARRTQYKRSFCLGAGVRVFNRIQARIKNTSESGVQGGGTNLPALMSLYDQARTKAKEFLKARGAETTQRVMKANPRNEEGWEDGRRAGETISLDAQIGNGHAVGRLEKKGG